MNKISLRILLCFTLFSAVISMLLLILNALSFISLSAEAGRLHPFPSRILLEISENLLVSDGSFALSDASLLPDEDWCLLLDGGGNVIWSQNKPDDVPSHFSLNDVARMTRWFFADYPVYVRTEDYGLFVLGLPKNSVGKYPLEFSSLWFETLPQRTLCILLFNFALSLALALLFGLIYYRRLRVLMQGIADLRLEKDVRLRERGLFRELSHSINETSSGIARKNAALRLRDQARSHWVAGVSHDIRTPLTVIMGYSEALSHSPELSEESRKRAQAITAQSVKVKKLVEDFNLISSLEYDMQPSQKRPFFLCPLIRSVVSDLLNSGLDARYSIALDLRFERAQLMGDEALLSRALFNLINNSVVHNPSGCRIRILEYTNSGAVCIELSDTGSGVPEEVLAKMDCIPQSAHGLGLPMAYRIIHVHGGKMTAANDGGLKVLIELPML